MKTLAVQRCALLAVAALSASGSSLATSTETPRPLLHFTAARHWINDPNGMVYLDGEYHLFFQYNPYGDRWGHMSWGHAVSHDLLHWRELPVAILEDDQYMIFSGSVVVDHGNSSGFGKAGRAPLVAIYTGNRQPNGGLQNQQLAYSLDKGRSWSKYAGNPVLDIGLAHFRDPKVFWYEPQHKWVMVAVLAERRQATLYESQDLKHWTHLSDFGPVGPAGGVWECPDFFMLPVAGEQRSRWVLKVDMFDGATAGGSGGQYFVGDFDGTRFTPDAEGGAAWLDYGADFYAAASWSNIPGSDGRHLWIGWMNDHHYAQYTPTAPWRGAMTLPRELQLQHGASGWALTQSPVRELLRARHTHVRRAAVPLTDDDASQGSEPLQRADGPGQALELVASLKAGSAGEFGVKVAVGDHEETVIGYDTTRQQLFVDRRRSGNVAFNDAFAARHVAPLALHGGRLKLHIVVDAVSVEVFANDGERVMTEQIFPSAASRGLALYARGGTAEVEALDLWELQ